jgi:single-stranded-DNA-specific exonuclease
MAKRWRIRPHDSERIAALQRVAGVPAVVAQLLLARGITEPGAVQAFLNPQLKLLREPDCLPGCLQAAERIHRAIAQRQKIVVYGDYDVDGMTGTALLWMCLRLLGADVSYYVPHRLDEGYGLHADAVRTWAEGKAGLMITVDCGITAVAEAELACQLGIDLIVTDHHQCGEQLPQAILVHPRLPNSDYPFGGLSGSGVALKLAWAVCQLASGAKKVNPRMKDFLVQAVGLAAMGTIADVVPLVDENRVLVHHGLASLAQCPTLGLATLMRVAKVQPQRAPQGRSRLDAQDVAFAIAPRLNAAGRLGQPQLAVELLVTDRPERAEELAQYIDQLNASRQSLERSIQLAASKQIKEQFDPVEEPALVLADRGWHPGVIGIVAGRLAEKHHRPVVMVSWDQMGTRPGVGSARSVPGFDLHAALAACSEHLLAHGGHAAAAGLKVEEHKLDAFRTAFCEVAAGEISDQERVADVLIDVEAPLGALSLQTVGQIEQLAPFGAQNPRPLVCATEVRLASPPKPLGNGGRHIAMRLEQHGVALRAVAFGGADWSEDLESLDGPLDVAFRPVINSYQGRSNVELHLVDWRASSSRLPDGN